MGLPQERPDAGSFASARAVEKAVRSKVNVKKYFGLRHHSRGAGCRQARLSDIEYMMSVPECLFRPNDTAGVMAHQPEIPKRA